MLSQILAISRNTFLESLRQPVFFVIVFASAVLQVFNMLLSAYTMGYTEDMEVSGDDKLLLDMGLATVMVCATLLAAFIATSVLSQEIQNKTVLTVISKPVGRPLFILGKYIGVSGAILIGSVIMTVFFLFMIRHGVMSTARDRVDLVVVFFGVGSILGSMALATWGNYFYGWVFSSTAILTMLPSALLGYFITLGISSQFEWQAMSTDFKPQVLIASGCAIVAILVLTSVALAASTRLGQVMTIVVCAGMLMLGLLSNHLFGRFAFSNVQVGVIREVENLDDVSMAVAGDTLTITLESPPKADVDPGRALYYGPEPSGLVMIVPRQAQSRVDIDDVGNISGPNALQGLVVLQRNGDIQLELLNTGDLDVRRPPREGDYLFANYTEYNYGAFGAWAIVPNLQMFWLVDAITQGHDVPPRYIALVLVYGAVQIVMFLSLSVLLFQRREVG